MSPFFQRLFEYTGGQPTQKHGAEMTAIQKHLDLLGYRVEDKVTGLKGVVTSVTFDLYGCVQAIVNPGIGPDGKQGEQAWFDVARLVITSHVRVMDIPNFDAGYIAEGLKGPAEKPVPRN